MPEIRELEVLALWRRPAGTLDRWVRWVIACACVTTIALAAVGPRVLWVQSWTDFDRLERRGYDAFWFCNGLAIVAACWIAASFVPRWRVSRYLRVAVLLPIVHLVLVAIAWRVWQHAAPHMPSIVSSSRLVVALPLGAIAAVLALVTVAVAGLIARGRREWSHAFVMAALVDLLLVGLWIPIACWIRCRDSVDDTSVLAHPLRLVAIVMLPPLVAAAGYTTLAIRCPELARQLRASACGFVIVLLGVGMILRANTAPAAAVVYANLIPILLATMVVTIAAVGGLGVTSWWRGRSTRRELARQIGVAGVIRADDDPPVVACLEIAGWLRGPRSRVRAFVASTAYGDLPVHGARLAAPIADATTQIRVGEAFAVLRAGDPITILGIDVPDPGDPFRTGAAPTAGVGVSILPRTPGPYGFADIALASWRPAIAYLVILVIVAAPALAALVAR